MCSAGVQWDTCGHMRHIHILTQLTEAIPLTKMPLKSLSPNSLDSNSSDVNQSATELNIPSSSKLDNSQSIEDLALTH